MTEIDIIEQRVKNLNDLAKETESKILKEFVNDSIRKCAKALTIIVKLKTIFDEQLQTILQNEIDDTYSAVSLCKIRNN